MADCRQRFW
jgi:hypothetical protein